MRVKFFLLITILMFSLTLKAQDLKTTLKQQANEMASASVIEDYNLVLKYTYPKFFEDFSREEILDGITKAMSNLKSQGIKIESAEIGELGIIYKAGKELHCLVSEKIILRTKQGRFQKDGNLLAISSDNGQNWYFLDCAAGKENIMMIFPDFNKELVIPEKTDLKKLDN